MYSDDDCPWYILDDSYKALLGSCTILLGFAGVVLNGWLIFTFIKSHLLSFKSHLLILNMCMASFGRGILGGFPFAGPSAIAGRWLFGLKCCKFFAFMHQLLGIFQMVSLTVLCFERYLLTKRSKCGKDLGIKFYIISIFFCWSYSLAFSIPPLISYGSFECDITGTICTLDWRYINLNQFSFNILVAIFGGIIPILIILFTFWKVIPMRTIRTLTEMDMEQWSLTSNTLTMTSVVLAFWLPQGVLSIWLASNSLATVTNFYRIPKLLTILAPLAAEAATMVPLLCFLSGEARIRTALLGRMKKNYGIIQGGNRSAEFKMVSS